MKIVVVDDSVTNLIVLKSLCSRIDGVSAVGFSDSEAAALHLAANQADAIILDYSMPKLNGIELVQRIRAMPGHRSTPVVMVTHSTEHETRKGALNAGVTAFLNKPVDAKEFRLVVRDVLEHYNRDVVIGSVG